MDKELVKWFAEQRAQMSQQAQEAQSAAIRISGALQMLDFVQAKLAEPKDEKKDNNIVTLEPDKGEA